MFVASLKAFRESILQVISQVLFRITPSFERLAIFGNSCMQLLIGTFFSIRFNSIESFTKQFDQFILEYHAAFKMQKKL